MGASEEELRFRPGMTRTKDQVDQAGEPAWSTDFSKPVNAFGLVVLLSACVEVARVHVDELVQLAHFKGQTTDLRMSSGSEASVWCLCNAFEKGQLRNQRRDGRNAMADSDPPAPQDPAPADGRVRALRVRAATRPARSPVKAASPASECRALAVYKPPADRAKTIGTMAIPRSPVQRLSVGEMHHFMSRHLEAHIQGLLIDRHKDAQDFQVRARTRKYAQVRARTRKYAQVRASTRKYPRVPLFLSIFGYLFIRAARVGTYFHTSTFLGCRWSVNEAINASLNKPWLIYEPVDSKLNSGVF